MGIQGLTSYIKSNETYFMEPFKLANLAKTYLVIDGNCISSSIYLSTSNSIFGGDYDKYATKISSFFNKLLKVQIIPLVLMDGGNEYKKLDTTFDRMQSDVNKGVRYISNHSRHLFGLFTNKVFMEVMERMEISFAQCKFEADHEIAAIARLLDAPVLSNDSDFFIFGVSYIPYSTLEFSEAKIPCMIYKVQKLLNHFEGLNTATLALAATLLGNDYTKMKGNNVQTAFNGIQLPEISGEESATQKRIIATFTWLSKRTLRSTILEILNSVPASSRNELFNSIRESVTVYTNLDSDMLVPLGFSPKFQVRMRVRIKGDQDTFESLLTKAFCEKIQFKEDLCANKNAKAFNRLPGWFQEEFYNGRIHPSFITMMTCRVWIYKPQIEDYSLPASTLISRKISLLIYRIASTASCYFEKDKVHEETWRRVGSSYERNNLALLNNFSRDNVPSLSDLTELLPFCKKKIFNDCLEVESRDLLHEVPVEWRLFFIAMKFWCIKGMKTTVVNKNHVYSLILCFLNTMTNAKFGFNMPFHAFKLNFQRDIDRILQKKKDQLTEKQGQQSKKLTIDESFEQVTFEDCVVPAEFFFEKRQTDPQLENNPKIFNARIVHAFAMFQSCLFDSNNLNAILKCVYEPTNVSHMLNGTLLYNLYNCLSECADAKVYVNGIFQYSPSLARLFYLIADKFEGIFNKHSS